MSIKNEKETVPYNSPCIFTKVGPETSSAREALRVNDFLSCY